MLLSGIRRRYMLRNPPMYTSDGHLGTHCEKSVTCKSCQRTVLHTYMVSVCPLITENIAQTLLKYLLPVSLVTNPLWFSVSCHILCQTNPTRAVDIIGWVIHHVSKKNIISDRIWFHDNDLTWSVITGEKLSKQQLHNSNIIKKLRSKEKEHENTINKQTKKIRELEEELQLLKQVGGNYSISGVICS